MNDLIAVKKLAEWDRLKALVLDSVSSLIARRVYNTALNEFTDWYQQPRGLASARRRLGPGVRRSKLAGSVPPRSL